MMDGQIRSVEAKIVPLAQAQDHSAIDRAKEFDEAFLAELAEAIGPLIYNYIVMPVGIVKKSAGGILFTDTSVDHQKWTHGLGRVMLAGPGVYRGQTFVHQGITPEMAPKPGDLVTYNPKVPQKFRFDGVELVKVPDNALDLWVNPKHAHRLAWDF